MLRKNVGGRNDTAAGSKAQVEQGGNLPDIDCVLLAKQHQSVSNLAVEIQVQKGGERKKDW